jgi:3-oxoacyl-[acyl-carrier-protein] synthase II
MNERRRVVITGLGLVSPLGCEVNQVWRDMCVGKSGVGELTKLDRKGFTRTRAAEVKGFDALPEATDPSLDGQGQAVRYMLAATRMALEDAGLPPTWNSPNNVGLAIGTTMGNQDVLEHVIDEFSLKEGDVPSEEAGRRLQGYRTSLLASLISERLNLEGASMVFPTACAAGNYALGAAHSMISSGRADMMVVGGADPFSRTCYTIFYRLGGSANTHPMPFDQNREGMVVGEGAGVLIVEDLETATKRGAKIYAEVSGYSLTCDAYHRTAPHPQARGAVAAMRNALQHAGLELTDIDYVSAHGTATPANDAAEAVAMSEVFGDRAPEVPVSSIKSMIGHCMGAASAIENVICAKAIQDELLPPTSTHKTLDASFPRPLDVVPGTARKKKINHLINNAFAFGGCVASVVLSRYEP